MSSKKSRSIKTSGKRSFTINNAYHVDGCPTKFSHGDYTGRYIAISAQRAAEKALSELCKLKNIRGQCTLYLEMRETTQGSNHTIYAYHAKRYRLSKPVEVNGIKYFYGRHAKPVERVPTEKCPKSHKSSGPMRSYVKKRKTTIKRNKTKSITNKLTNRIKKSINKLL